MVLGALLALAIMVAMQIPLLHDPASSALQIHVVDPPTANPVSLDWPATGSAALLIPSLGVAEAWHDKVAPIASLTKMMTAYVVLKKLPLSLGETGPCVSVSAYDVARYQEIKATGGSNVFVSEGESLCEIDLLDGLLVHSANNYAEILAQMVAGTTSNFVALMNETAASLGLGSTHYADVSGYMDGSVSTALEQGRLAELLMQSPVVQSIVKLPSIVLPEAGAQGSYTPFVGTDNVIGVKSGRTDAAGGCDVMAMTFQQGTTTRVLYAVVLGQRGGDMLGPAGLAALGLANSAVRFQEHFLVDKGAPVATFGWGRDIAPLLAATRYEVWWWPMRRDLAITLDLKRVTSSVHRGEVVGWLIVHGDRASRVALRTARSISPPSVWQRLR